MSFFKSVSYNFQFKKSFNYSFSHFNNPKFTILHLTSLISHESFINNRKYILQISSVTVIVQAISDDKIIRD